jgi:hypothetical protein
MSVNKNLVEKQPTNLPTWTLVENEITNEIIEELFDSVGFLR